MKTVLPKMVHKTPLQALLLVIGLLSSQAMMPFFAHAQQQAQVQTPPTAQTLTIRAVGDVLPGSYTPQQMIPPDSGAIFVRNVRQYLMGADIVFGNFEGTFIRKDDPTMKPQKCSEASRKRGVCFEFGVPPHLAPMLKQLGFTVMSVDNNHADDYGAAAAEFTKQTLAEQGIKPAPKRGYALLNVRGKRVAVVAFGFSNTSYNIADLSASREAISKLKQLTGSSEKIDRIIVSFHGGAEGKGALHTPNKTEMFVGENRGNVVQFARACIDAGADLVLGHGPHVLRAAELYKNKFIIYSMGNFLTYGNINVKGVSGVTCVLEVSIDTVSGEFVAGRVVPVVQREPGIPEYDPTNQAVKLLQGLMVDDFPQSPLELTNDGVFKKK